MILLVSMTRPEDYDGSGSDGPLKHRLEQLTGHPCLVSNYPAVSIQFVRKYAFKAIFIGGFGYGWEQVSIPKVRPMAQLLREIDIPVLGACGGHQLVGYLFQKDLKRIKGFRNQPMRRLRPGEPDIEPAYHPGYLKERGVYDVKVLRDDPLFAGLPKIIRVPENHYAELKKVPKEFLLLASNENCKIQAIRHKTKPIYGTQFHPEKWDDTHPHGKKVLLNFFRLAGM